MQNHADIIRLHSHYRTHLLSWCLGQGKMPADIQAHFQPISTKDMIVALSAETFCADNNVDMPTYRTIMGLLLRDLLAMPQGKNKYYRWFNGAIDWTAPWQNPEFALLVGQLSNAISNNPTMLNTWVNALTHHPAAPSFRQPNPKFLFMLFATLLSPTLAEQPKTTVSLEVDTYNYIMTLSSMDAIFQSWDARFPEDLQQLAANARDTQYLASAFPEHLIEQLRAQVSTEYFARIMGNADPLRTVENPDAQQLMLTVLNTGQMEELKLALNLGLLRSKSGHLTTLAAMLPLMNLQTWAVVKPYVNAYDFTIMQREGTNPLALVLKDNVELLPEVISIIDPNLAYQRVFDLVKQHYKNLPWLIYSSYGEIPKDRQEAVLGTSRAVIELLSESSNKLFEDVVMNAKKILLARSNDIPEIIHYLPIADNVVAPVAKILSKIREYGLQPNPPYSVFKLNHFIQQIIQITIEVMPPEQIDDLPLNLFVDAYLDIGNYYEAMRFIQAILDGTKSHAYKPVDLDSLNNLLNILARVNLFSNEDAHLTANDVWKIINENPNVIDYLQRPLAPAIYLRGRTIDLDRAREFNILGRLNDIKVQINPESCTSLTIEQIEHYILHRKDKSISAETESITHLILGAIPDEGTEFNYLLGDLYNVMGKYHSEHSNQKLALKIWSLAYHFGNYDTPRARMQHINRRLKAYKSLGVDTQAYVLLREEIQNMPASYHQRLLKMLNALHTEIREKYISIEPELEEVLVNGYKTFARFIESNGLDRQVLDNEICYSPILYHQEEDNLSLPVYVCTGTLMFSVIGGVKRTLGNMQRRIVYLHIIKRYLSLRKFECATLARFFPNNPLVEEIQQLLEEQHDLASCDEARNGFYLFSKYWTSQHKHNDKSELLSKIEQLESSLRAKVGELLTNTPLSTDLLMSSEQVSSLSDVEFKCDDKFAEFLNNNSFLVGTPYKGNLVDTILTSEDEHAEFLNKHTTMFSQMVLHRLELCVQEQMKAIIDKHCVAIQAAIDALTQEIERRVRQRQADKQHTLQVYEQAQSLFIALQEKVRCLKIEMLYDVEKIVPEVMRCKSIQDPPQKLQSILANIQKTYQTVSSLENEEQGIIVELQSKISEYSQSTLSEDIGDAIEQLAERNNALMKAFSLLDRSRGAFAKSISALKKSLETKRRIQDELDKYSEKRGGPTLPLAKVPSPRPAKLPEKQPAPKAKVPVAAPKAAIAFFKKVPPKAPINPLAYQLQNLSDNGYLNSINKALLNLQEIYSQETGYEEMLPSFLEDGDINKCFERVCPDAENRVDTLLFIISFDAKVDAGLRFFNGMHEAINCKDAYIPDIIDHDSVTAIRHRFAHNAYRAYTRVAEFDAAMRRLQEVCLPAIQRLLANQPPGASMRFGDFCLLREDNRDVVGNPQFHLHRLVDLANRLDLYRHISIRLLVARKTEYERDTGIIHAAIRSVIAQISEHLNALPKERYRLGWRHVFKAQRNIEAHEIDTIAYEHMLNCADAAQHIVTEITNNYLDVQFADNIEVVQQTGHISRGPNF